jgi:uncharacterized phage-associated protein
LDVADFFIGLSNETEDAQMTNGKLNALLYYAQGAFLARMGSPLFEEDMEAWKLGPVVPCVYHRYKVCGRNPIQEQDSNWDGLHFSDEELEVLLDVMREYGPFTGSKLVAMTHPEGSPWSETAAAGQKIIDREAMRKFFTENPVPRLTERIHAPVVDKLPADWYDPDEDSEWEAYLSLQISKILI